MNRNVGLPRSPRDRRFGHVAVAVFVVLASVMALGACSKKDSGKSSTTTAATNASTAVDAAALAGKSFTVKSVEGHETVKDSKITVAFADGNLSVRGGCNTMASGFEVTGGKLKWSGHPVGTQMMCEDPLVAQDKWLSDLFTNGVDAKWSGTDLLLSAGDVSLTLTADA